MNDSTPAIDVADLTVAYRDQPVLWDLDLRVPKGILMAVVGPNGAGKTTLIKLLTRLYEPSEGRILLDGEPARKSARLLPGQTITVLGQAWPWGDVPVTTWTFEVGRMRTVAASQPPAE